MDLTGIFLLWVGIIRRRKYLKNRLIKNLLCIAFPSYDLKVVFISSYQNYEYFRYAIQFRGEDYLLKPIKSGDQLTRLFHSGLHQVLRKANPTFILKNFRQIIGT